MKLKFILSNDITIRTATILVEELSKINGEIFINKDQRSINGKSIIGVLSGQFKSGDQVDVDFQNDIEIEKIEKIFKEIGRQVNG